MRIITSWLNLIASVSLMYALYTGLDTITHKVNNPIFHGFVGFFTIFLSCIALANSMMYTNTLHKEIDELKNKISDFEKGSYEHNRK
jgi:putative effector of murein hydrolase